MRLVEYTFSDDIENKLDILFKYCNYQWWLYRGSLSRQSLNLSYYKDWYRLYNKYSNITDSIYDADTLHFESQIKQFQLIENSLDSEREKLKSVLYSGPYNELDICFNKIKSYIDSIIDILRGMSNEW